MSATRRIVVGIALVAMAVGYTLAVGHGHTVYWH